MQLEILFSILVFSGNTYPSQETQMLSLEQRDRPESGQQLSEPRFL